MLLGACISLVGFGVVMGTSPTLYALTLHMLSQGRSGERRVHWMTLGMFLAGLVLLAVFRTVDPETLTKALEGRVEALLVRRGIDLLAGLLLIVAAVWRWHVYRTKPFRGGTDAQHHHQDSPGRLVGLGFVNTAVSAGGAATTYMAGRLITGTTHHVWAELPLYLVFLVAVVAPYWIAAYGWSRLPRVAQRVETFTHWLGSKDLRPLQAVVLALAGIVFLVMGLGG